MSDQKCRQPTKARSSKKVNEIQVTPEKDEKDELLRIVGTNNRTILASLITAAGIGNKRDSMSAVADSIMNSFDIFRNTVDQYVATKDVCFDVEFDDNRTINSVMFSEQITGVLHGNPLNVNIDYFSDLYNQKRDFDPPGRYKRHEYVEYKYNVSNLIQYYTKRFPEIIDLFNTFSDICLNKSDIGVSVEFSDEFIHAFFVDEFQKQIEEQERIDKLLTKQSTGINKMNSESDQTVST